MIAKRRRLLSYLRKHDINRYNSLVEKLDLGKKEIVNEKNSKDSK